jgi:hemoglobin
MRRAFGGSRPRAAKGLHSRRRQVMKCTRDTMTSSDFEQLGGEPALRAIIDRFIDRVFADQMIGFFFARVDRQRIKDKEYEFAAAHLGGGVAYTGRPLPVAHGHHPIMGGHFMRRIQILRETLSEFGVANDLQERWLAFNQELQPVITASPGSECRTEALEGREAASVKTARALPVTGSTVEAPLGQPTPARPPRDGSA